MDGWKEWLLAVLVCLFCVFGGMAYGAGENTKLIAASCERLGNFLAGDKPFACAPKEVR